MTFDEWLDEGKITTRRKRLERFMAMPDTPHKREMMMGWLWGAWNAGIKSGILVPRDEWGFRSDTEQNATGTATSEHGSEKPDGVTGAPV